jgi:serine protease
MKKRLLLSVFVFLLPAMVTLAVAGQPANAPDRAQKDAAIDYVAGEVLVRFNPEVDTAQAASLAADHSLSAQECIASINLCRMQILDGTSEWDTVQRVGSDPRVLYVEPNYIDHVYGETLQVTETVDRVANDPMYGSQWHYQLINMPAAWNRITGQSSMVIAVVDTGVRFDHPDLAGRLSANGYDFVDLDNNPTDPSEGHGTHVAGTIAAATNNGVGVAGMTWRGTILPIRTLSASSGTHFNFSQGFRYAAGLLAAPDPVNPTPARVINYSAGGSDSATKKDAVAAVNAAGVVMVCSAGNTGGAIGYPGAYSPEYPMLVCVGSTGFGNGSPTLAYYSSRGPALNVVAPGGDMSVDSDGDGELDGVLSTTWDYASNSPVYEYWQGTSMAAPHVTGLTALLLGAGYPAAKVRARLQNTATDLGAAGFDNDYGWGLINAEQALGSVGKPDLMISYLQGLGASSRVSLGANKVVFRWRALNRARITSGPTIIKFWLSSNTLLEATDIYLGAKNVPELEGGVGTTLTKSSFSLLSPVDANVRWYVIGKVDSPNSVAESNEDNNVRAGQLTDL